jgi:NitT/TauT family transport system substrate-binding protein
MNKRTAFIATGTVLLLLVLLLSIISPWQKKQTSNTLLPTLRIGYLPITHAALPLVVYSQAGEGKLENFNLDLVRFSNWAELAEALQSGQIDGGGDILNNLAFKIVSKGVPLQSVLMAVRAGSALTVNPKITDGGQLKDKTIAIPSRFSPHYILLYQYLKDHGLDIQKDVKILEMAPSDMVQALAAGSIDGYIVAEPFNAQAEEMGIGKVLVLSRDIELLGAKNLECGITLRKEFVDRYPQATQEFVDKMIQAGIWIGNNPQEAAELVAPMIGQKASTIEHAFIDPPGRTQFIDLYPRVDEYNALQSYMISLGLLDQEIDINLFVNSSFAEKSYEKFGLKKQQW